MRKATKKVLSFLLAIALILSAINVPTVSHAGGDQGTPLLTLGSISSTNGLDAESTTRCVSGSYDLSEFEVAVTPASGVKYGVHCYGEDGSYLGWTNWLRSGSYFLVDGTSSVRLVMAYTDNRSITNDQLTELANMVNVTEIQQLVEVTSISLDTMALELYVGDSATLTAEIMPSDASDKGIAWSSSDTGVVTVNGGVVYAVAPGTALITATAANDMTATCPVRVVAQNQGDLWLSRGSISSSTGLEVPATNRCVTDSFNLDEYEVAVAPASNVKYGVHCYDADGSYLGWTNWLRSSEYQVIEGTSSIRIVMAYTVSTNMGEAQLIELSSMISVTDAYVEVTSISLNTTTIDLFVGDYAEIMAEVEPESASDPEVEWSSSDEGVATVCDGEIYAVAPGTTVITATASNGMYATCSVRVSTQNQGNLWLSQGSISSTNGLETPATNRCLTDSFDLDEYEVSVTPASNVKYGVHCYDANGSYLGWTNWLRTSEYQVIEGTSSIRIVMAYTVSTTIGESELVELSNMINVTEIYVEVTSISLDVTALNLYVGDTAEISAEIEPENASDPEVEWSSSDEGVATIYNGVIYAIAPGTAVITATASNGMTATCPVKVSEQNQGNLWLTLGTISSTTGMEGTSATRCISHHFGLDLSLVEVTPDSNVKYGVHCYGENGNYLGWTGWLKTSDYQSKLKAGTVGIRIIMAYDDNRSISDAQLVELSSMINVCILAELEYGSISSSTGLDTESATRCRSYSYNIEDYDIQISPLSSLKYGVHCYDRGGSYLGWTGWIKTSEFQVKPNTYYIRFVLAYDDNRTLTDADLTAFSKLIRMSEKEAVTYTVTYDAGLGMFPSTKQSTYVVTVDQGPYYLDNYGEDMVPVLEGYEFHGWLYQGKFVEQVNLTSNIVLTPMWVQVYDLVFDTNGGYFLDDNAQVATKTVRVGPGTHRLDVVMGEEIYDPIRPGYAFVGWLYNDKIVKKVKITDASVTVVAQWEPAYNVTYDANGGKFMIYDFQEEQYIEYTEYIDYDVIGGVYYLNGPEPYRGDATSNANYKFECWTMSVNNVDVRVDESVNLTGDLTLKAQWSKELQITFDANGGEFHDGTTTFVDYAYCGQYSSYWVDDNNKWPECEGCSFLGWNTQADATTGSNNFDAILTQDTTYYAIWTENPAITYDANGGYFYWDNAVDESGNIIYDQEGNPVRYQVTTRTREVELGENDVDGFGVDYDGPYQFIGWSTSAKATTATYQPGDPITITGSITLYAVFKQMPTIVYNANGGGWGHYEPIPSATEGGDATEQFVIDDNYKMHWDNAGFYYYVGCDSPERPGYEFLGWYTTTGENGLKADDDELILAEGATYYYYAHWAKRVTVTYVTNEPNTGWGWWDYQYDENEVRSIVFEQTSFTRDTIAGSDYKIDGWRPDAADSPAKFLGYTTNPKGTVVEYEVDDPIELTDDITLYAVWTQNPTIHYVCDEKDAGWYGFWDDVDGDGEEECVFETQERLDWRNLGEHEYYVYHVGFEAPQRPGYEFDHWVDDQGVNADDRALTLHDGDVYTFHATWRKIVTVTYTTNIGGWGWYDNDAPEGEKYEYVEFNNYDRDWGDMWTGEYHVDGWTPNCCDGPYEFVGYATDEDATEATLQPGQKITLTDDTTFFAIWKQLPTIIYDGNGGGWGEYDEDEDTYEESTKLDWRTPGHYYHVRYEQPHRENYDFDGWVDAQGVPKDDVALLLADGDEFTFYAKWIPHVTIVYYANGGEFDGWEPNEGESPMRHIRHEQACDEYWLDGWHPNREGYDFGGWSLTLVNQQKVTEPYNLTQDTMFYAIWLEPLTVTYDANGGVWYDWAEDPTTGEYQTVTLTQQQQTDVHRGWYDVGYEWPQREGYDFVGWARARDSREASEGWGTTINGNTTFYAIWKKLTPVTFDAGEGYLWYDEDTKEEVTTWTSYARPNEVIRPEWLIEFDPEREGYRFDGWLYDGNALRWVRASQALTFTADWVKTYEVQLVANGGYFNSFDEWNYEGSFDTWQDGEDYVFYKQQCDDGEGYDFFNGGFPVPQRDGYTFIGWSYPSDNDENLVYAENIVINGADMELFAQWEPIPDYEPEMISANDYQ